MKKIALILPWFGRVHEYFDLFLSSVSKNVDLDLLIFSNEKIDNKYDNIKVYNVTFNSIQRRIKALHPNLNISLITPYRLCDFKPAYGEIFKTELRGYEFWGHCDADMILGDLSKFITNEILNQNDKIFTRGHLTIYRNSEFVNGIYKKCSLYKKAFTENDTHAFDEWGGVSKFWDEHNLKYYDELLFDDILPNKKDLRPSKEISGSKGPYHSKNMDQSGRYRNMKNIIYRFENGTLKRLWLCADCICEEEVLYVHLQKRKMCNFVTDYNCFLITPNNFVDNTDVNKEKLIKFSTRRLNFGYCCEVMMRLVKKVTKRCVQCY